MSTRTPFKTPWIYRLGIVLLVAGVFVTIHQWPREDNRQAVLSYAQSLARVPAIQNAYFAILGLGASPDLDPVEVAQRVVSHVVDSNPPHYHPEVLDTTPHTVDISAFLGEGRYATRNIKSRYCREPKETPDCLHSILAQQDKIKHRLATEYVFVQRLVALRQLQWFDEPLLGDLLLESGAIRTMADVSDLLNAGIAIEMETPVLRQAALSGLEQDLLMWTRLLTQASGWTTRYVHQLQVVRKYQLLSALMRRHPSIVTEHGVMVARMTQPLTQQFTRLKPQMDEEFQMEDLWGISRLLELQRQITLANVPSHRVTQFLAEAGPALADPHSKLPMHYDAASHSISFLPRNSYTEKSGRNRVTL